MDWTSFLPSPAKTAFINGMTVLTPGGWPSKPPPADYFWNPRGGGWFTYPSSSHAVEDRGWPTTDISGLFIQAGPLFDKITQQYYGLAERDRPYAMWSPVNGKWMYVAQKTSNKGDQDRDKALAKLLTDVYDLHRRGHLSVSATNDIHEIVQREM